MDYRFLTLSKFYLHIRKNVLANIIALLKRFVKGMSYIVRNKSMKNINRHIQYYDVKKNNYNLKITLNIGILLIVQYMTKY